MPLKTNQWLSKAAQTVSVVCHPVFIPLYAVWFYFKATPRYFISQNQKFLYLYLLIVAIIIPLLFFAVMLLTKSFSGYQLKKTKERLFFSVIMAVVYLIIFQKLTKYHQFIELYPFFLGIFLSILVLAFYNYFGQKPSIHAMALSGLLTFFMMWSYYSRVNILNYVTLCLMAVSIVSAARIYLKAHSLKDVARGIIIGVTMQFLAFYIVWLYY